MSRESIISAAVAFMEKIAADSTHGYDQSSRWGPNYDCSSLVITAYESAGAGVKTAGATYTGNMYAVFLKCGFTNVTSSVTLSTGSGLQAGDVLLNVSHHTAMHIGSGKIAQASINEKGTVTGGTTGDQTGNEINTRSYYNYPWNYVLRYTAGESATTSTARADTTTAATGTTYTVVSGDSLWKIAKKYGTTVSALAALNGITNTALIHVGQVLNITADTTATTATSSTSDLPELSYGDTGDYVTKMQKALIAKGYTLPKYGADGDFGSETLAAVKKFQTAKGLTVDGVVGTNTWAALLS